MLIIVTILGAVDSAKEQNESNLCEYNFVRKAQKERKSVRFIFVIRYFEKSELLLS